MMKQESVSPDIVSETSSPETNSRSSEREPVQPHLQGAVKRRSFLKGIVVAGAAVTAGAAMLENIPSALAEEGNGNLTRGDAAILKWLAAAEIIESDLWLQYQELAGSQDDEVAKIASRLIRGYPAVATGGSPAYTNAVSQLDGDMAQYIHDNTEDEFTHQAFINAFLISKGHDPVNLERFRILPSSKATGANQVGRLTNLMQLTVDTTWWTRYRSRTGNPDLGDSFSPAIPTLGVNQHTAIPRTDADLNDPNFLQAIANTAGFHFANLEVGGSSMYPSLAQRVSDVHVLRILLAIGPTETSHFQTWHDKAGNAIPSPNGQPIIDPVTKVPVLFPDLTAAAVPPVGEDLQSNLIMPEPTVFFKGLPICSIIRPTETKNAAQVALQGFVTTGAFVGQSKQFMNFVTGLAVAADEARRGVS
jgi:hypothetical protein